jgi:ribosome maturation factor RimP
MDVANRVEQLIGPAVNDLGFDIVRVQLSGTNSQQLQIMAEPLAGGGMAVDDCARISRTVSAVLDVEDPISGPYRLEVSSPGLDRPLVKIGDFERYAGFEAKVEVHQPINGRKRFRGRVMGVDGETVKVLVEDAEMEFPYSEIHRAKLIVTDDVLAKVEEQRKQ